jgi:hypothetical protein
MVNVLKFSNFLSEYFDTSAHRNAARTFLILQQIIEMLKKNISELS